MGKNKKIKSILAVTAKKKKKNRNSVGKIIASADAKGLKSI